MDDNTAKLIEVARTWLNTPWKHNGKVKGVEVDCVNFLLESGKEAGLKLPDLPDQYGRVAIADDITKYLEENLEKKHIDIEPYIKSNAVFKDSGIIEAGNVILYKLVGYNTHVAIATSSNTIIHACNYKRYNKVIEHPIDGVWRNRINSIWIIKWD